MCSVIILADQAGLTLTMNRDERRERPDEYPISDQAFSLDDDTSISGLLAPRDGLHGGTWIALRPSALANQISWACLLNAYDTVARNPAWRSRGMIIPRLMAATRPEDILHRSMLRDYPPFHILYGTAALVWQAHWNGHEISQRQINGAEPWQHCATSSSYDATTILPYRQAHFTAWRQAGMSHDPISQIPAINLWRDSHDPAKGIFMSRADAATTSITQIRLPVAEPPSMSYYPANTLSPLRPSWSAPFPDIQVA